MAGILFNLHEEGTRVGAILSIEPENKCIKFLGYGTFLGCEKPTSAKGYIAEITKQSGLSNPKIQLDNGKIVWGCECWWGPEEAIKAEITLLTSKGFTVENVDMDAIRKEIRHG